MAFRPINEGLLQDIYDNLPATTQNPEEYKIGQTGGIQGREEEKKQKRRNRLAPQIGMARGKFAHTKFGQPFKPYMDQSLRTMPQKEKAYVSGSRRLLPKKHKKRCTASTPSTQIEPLGSDLKSLLDGIGNWGCVTNYIVGFDDPLLCDTPPEQALPAITNISLIAM